ncbi:MAG TPA: AMP-binding protein [Rhodocyclaceae bacterium]
MTPSSHIDTFARDNLPAPERWPELIFELPELQYPPRLNCAVELLDRAVLERGWGERIALRGHWGSLSYRELLSQANRIARVLAEDMGVVPGNRVLLHAPNGPMMAAAWLAIQKVGAVAVSTMPLLRAKELTDIVTKARISHALSDQALLAELQLAQAQCPTLTRVLTFGDGGELEAHMAGKPDDFANVDTAADDVCMIAFTSGTTGRPKGTMHFHRDVLAICDCFPRYLLRPTPDDIFCGTAPLGFTFGLGGLLLFPLRFGASAVLGIKSGAEELLKAIADYRVTICFAVPTGYRQMLPRLTGADLSSLRQCISAGEALPLATREAWFQATGIQLTDGIGATEMLHVFVSAAGNEIRPGAIGRPVPGYRAVVLDNAGQPLPPGQVGRLAVKGPTGCRYLDDPRQMDYVVNGWNVTGDTALMDTDGYLYYQARNDDMIISAGHNIGGPEVEDALLKHPAVAECAVIGAPDDERGQAVKAFVVVRNDVEADEELIEELQEHTKRLLAPFKYPRVIEFRRTLPRTETGKLQRFKLRDEERRQAPPPPRPLTPPPAAPAATPATTPHRVLQPEGWARPRGFANGMAAKGVHISIAGQIGWDGQCRFHSDNFVEQARQALENIVAVVKSAGGGPEHIVRLTWFVTDRKEYLAQAHELGAAYRSVMGRHFPPMSVVQVAALVEDRAKVEIEGSAIIPEG